MKSGNLTSSACADQNHAPSLTCVRLEIRRDACLFW